MAIFIFISMALTLKTFRRVTKTINDWGFEGIWRSAAQRESK